MKLFKTLLLAIVVAFTITGCDYTEETRPIKSIYLKQSTETHSRGSMFLMFGTYRSDEEVKTRYYLYVKGVEGYRLQQVDADKLEIVETNDVEPCIKGYFRVDGSINDIQDYIVYIPEDSIVEEYKVSLVQSLER